MNPFAKQPNKADTAQSVWFIIFRMMTYFVLLCGAVVFFDIFYKGGKVIFKAEPPFVNTTFLTEFPETLHVFDNPVTGRKCEMGEKEFQRFKLSLKEKGDALQSATYVYSAGGIFPCIVGTVLLVLGSMTIALVLGVMAAIYLSEYSKHGPFIQWVRLAISNLAGVPSIVFGLFGFGMFVIFMNWNVSLLSGWFTLAFMVLPIVITASEESLRAVPKGFREGSLALGATKWQTIYKNVLPYALPGMLTSSILSIARVAGETAPIMFTAAYVVRDELPWEGLKNTGDFFFQGVQALPYHIYVVSSKIPQNEYTQRVQYGTAFVFLFIVIAIAMASIFLRAKLRAKYRW